MERRRVRSLLLALPALLLVLLLPRVGHAQEGAIAGTVTNDLGTGLGTVQVEVLRGDGSVVAGAFSTASGSFRITNVPAGTYTVSFTLPGWEFVEQDAVIVTAGQKRTSTLSGDIRAAVAYSSRAASTSPLAKCPSPRSMCS